MAEEVGTSGRPEGGPGPLHREVLRQLAAWPSGSIAAPPEQSPIPERIDDCRRWRPSFDSNRERVAAMRLPGGDVVSIASTSALASLWEIGRVAWLSERAGLDLSAIEAVVAPVVEHGESSESGSIRDDAPFGITKLELRPVPDQRWEVRLTASRGLVRTARYPSLPGALQGTMRAMQWWLRQRSRRSPGVGERRNSRRKALRDARTMNSVNAALWRVLGSTASGDQPLDGHLASAAWLAEDPWSGEAALRCRAGARPGTRVCDVHLPACGILSVTAGDDLTATMVATEATRIALDSPWLPRLGCQSGAAIQLSAFQEPPPTRLVGWSAEGRPLAVVGGRAPNGLWRYELLRDSTRVAQSQNEGAVLALLGLTRAWRRVVGTSRAVPDTADTLTL